MKKQMEFKKFEDFINEASTAWAPIMKAVKSGGPGPWSIVAIEYNKVVDQDLVPVRDAIPAHYESMRKKRPRARIRIEDSEGLMVFEK